MAEPLIVSTLHRKRDKIEAVIAAYEARIATAKIDLAHVNKALALFDPDIGQPFARLRLLALAVRRKCWGRRDAILFG